MSDWGTGGPIELVRDRFGVPHIRAETTADLFFAQGYVHAADRIFQMDADRRKARGRWAEWVGHRGIANDLLVRRVDLSSAARADWDRFDDDTRSMLEHYAAGINAWLATAELPLEYELLAEHPEPWEPWHASLVYKIRHLLMGPLQLKLWRACVVRALGPEILTKLRYDDEGGDLACVPPGAEFRSTLDASADLARGVEALGALTDPFGGSNNWALSGSRTATGMPLLAGDPHRGLDVPNVYHPEQLTGPDFDAIGLAIPGVPGLPHFGHNDRVAWCITHAFLDDQDLYVERFRPSDPPLYLVDDEWRPAEQRIEQIKVRDRDTIDVTITRTRHGGIIAGDPACGAAIAMRWTSTCEPNPGLTTLLPMLRAHTVDELRNAMREWVEPGNNLLAADRDGHIGYLLRGRVPRRPRINGWLPVPGWKTDHDWRGWVPFDELPRATDPECGYLLSANNRPVDDAYPHFISVDFQPPSRALRIRARLEDIEAATSADMLAVLRDHTSLPAKLFSERFATAEPRTPAGAAVRQALDGWNGEIKADSSSAAAYAIARNELTLEVLERSGLDRVASDWLRREPPGVGTTAHLWWIVPRLLRDDDTTLLGGAGWAELLAIALDRAGAWLSDRLGPVPANWRWGALHRTWMFHPLSAVFPEHRKLLDPPSVELNGDGDTVFAAGYTPSRGFGCVYGSVARYVFDLADWDASSWIVPLGVSGRPGDPHSSDQLAAWAGGQLVPMLYSRAAVNAAAESRQLLEPRGAPQ